MGFLEFLKKKEKRRPIQPVSDVEFPILPPEEDLLSEGDELEIPAPPSFMEEEDEKPEPAFEEEPEEISTKGMAAMPLPGIEEVEKELKLKPSKAIYVKINRYKNVLGELKIIKNRLSEADDALGRVVELKAYKDKEFIKWKEGLEDLQRKLIFVDRTLFGG